jgi:hypothetical protein
MCPSHQASACDGWRCVATERIAVGDVTRAQERPGESERYEGGWKRFLLQSWRGGLGVESWRRGAREVVVCAEGAQ